MIEGILDTVKSAGIAGAKKADLKKQFGKGFDGSLDALVRDEKVFVEKKGTAYYLWTKENYILHLTENDAKFRLVLEMMVGLGHSVARLKDHAQSLHEELDRVAVRGKEPDADFQGEFDRCLRESGTSIGWTPLASVRERICGTRDMSKEKFYSLAGDLVERNRERYELSSGGMEGIVIRGMVHGFVRTI